jgi:hypothetical protein
MKRVWIAIRADITFWRPLLKNGTKFHYIYGQFVHWAQNDVSVLQDKLSLSSGLHSCIVCGWCRVQNSVRRPSILTEVFVVFLSHSKQFLVDERIHSFTACSVLLPSPLVRPLPDWTPQVRTYRPSRTGTVSERLHYAWGWPLAWTAPLGDTAS